MLIMMVSGVINCQKGARVRRTSRRAALAGRPSGTPGDISTIVPRSPVLQAPDYRPKKRCHISLSAVVQRMRTVYWTQVGDMQHACMNAWRTTDQDADVLMLVAALSSLLGHPPLVLAVIG